MGSFILFTACASSQERAQTRKDSAEFSYVRKTLRAGMTYEEVQQVSTKMGNCTGSPTGAQQCEAQYMTTSPRYNPIAPTISDIHPTATYESIVLNFKQGRAG